MNGLGGDLSVAMDHDGIDVLDWDRLLDLLSVFVFRRNDECFAAATDARLGSTNVQCLLLPKRRKQRGSFLYDLGLRFGVIGCRVRWYSFSISNGKIGR